MELNSITGEITQGGRWRPVDGIVLAAKWTVRARDYFINYPSGATVNCRASRPVRRRRP